VMIVSFSGIDGAGKSTQIQELELWLRQSGLRTRVVTFWDDVVVLSGVREFMSLRLFRGDQGVGSPEKPLNRCDKNVTSCPVTALRLFLYLADALSLQWKIRRVSTSQTDVVIFDRYIYDELANLPLDRPFARAFVALVLKLVPKPDVTYVIDADPLKALARKPEYPLEFLCRNREAYLMLAQLSPDVTVIAPGSIDRTQTKIRQKLLRQLWTGSSSYATS
jgi:thymidylate kinase